MHTDDPTKLILPSRQDLVHAISQAMLYQGRKRVHHWDRFNAQIAAENLIDGLAKSNYVIMRGPPLLAHSNTGQTGATPDERSGGPD